jgi:hypothetical protein
MFSAESSYIIYSLDNEEATQKAYNIIAREVALSRWLWGNEQSIHLLSDELKEEYGLEFSTQELNNMRHAYIREMQSITSLVNEQKEYAETKSDCMKWFILAMYANKPLGGIFVFYNPKTQGHIPESSYIMIQAITKYTIPLFLSLIDGNYKNKLPKVNNILEPAIEYLAKSLNVDYIYVHPVGMQGELLQKYYGYKPLPNNYHLQRPCTEIYEVGEEFTNKYYKPVIYEKFDNM